MLYKKNIALFFMLFSFFSWGLSEASVREDRLSGLTIHPDSPDWDSVGYHDLNMNTNGERLVMSLLRPNDRVFDIGAHTGEWTTYALASQPKVKIECFEPIPFLFEHLRIRLFLKPVVLNCLALSDHNGHSTFVYYPDHPDLSTLHRRPEIEKQLNTEPLLIQVNLEKMDSYCLHHQIDYINFVKIDTEGNEFNVLKGADILLRNQAIDIIQFEYGGCYLDSKTTLKQVYDYLTDCDYTVYRIASIGLIEITTWRDSLENFTFSNYLAVKNS